MIQADLADDPLLRRRVTACAALAGVSDPEAWAWERRWQLSAAAGWVDAYASAVSADTPQPGAAAAVITDAMIRDAVNVLTGGEASG